MTDTRTDKTEAYTLWSDDGFNFITGPDGWTFAGNLQAAVDELNTLYNENARLQTIVDKLPVAEDGARVVPNVDPIWICPDEVGGWLHEGHSFGRFDDLDNYIAARPIEIKSWSHYGDHIWVALENIDGGDHWFGKFYSTPEAARESTP